MTDRESQGLCDVTLTERFRNPQCVCETYEGNLGPCNLFEVGANGRCVYCDHEGACHPARPENGRRVDLPAFTDEQLDYVAEIAEQGRTYDGSFVIGRPRKTP